MPTDNFANCCIIDLWIGPSSSLRSIPVADFPMIIILPHLRNIRDEFFVRRVPKQCVMSTVDLARSCGNYRGWLPWVFSRLTVQKNEQNTWTELLVFCYLWTSRWQFVKKNLLKTTKKSKNFSWNEKIVQCNFILC